jgi:hypothetical protein
MRTRIPVAARPNSAEPLASPARVREHRAMTAAGGRSERLLPLRLVAALLIAAQGWTLAWFVAERNELLVAHPTMTQKLLATMIALTFCGSVALAFLAFWRQRFGLWIALACAAAELALETWAAFSPLMLLRIPVATALVFRLASRAWPALRRTVEPR